MQPVRYTVQWVGDLWRELAAPQVVSYIHVNLRGMLSGRPSPNKIFFSSGLLAPKMRTRVVEFGKNILHDAGWFCSSIVEAYSSLPPRSGKEEDELRWKGG